MRTVGELDLSHGMGYHTPTPQAGRVTNSDGGGRVRVGGGGCERSSAPLSNGQLIQKHRGGNRLQ
jgi:hypothetical protein